MLEKDPRNRVLLKPDRGGVPVGTNSIWAKLQTSIPAIPSTPDAPVKQGQFPATGTSLYLPNGLRPVEGTPKRSKWVDVAAQLSQKYPAYLETLEHLRRYVNKQPFQYVFDAKFTPAVIRSLIERKKLELQPEHMKFFVEEVLKGVPEKYRTSAAEDYEKHFCGVKEWDLLMDGRLKGYGFVSIADLGKEGQNASRWGLRRSKFNWRLYTTDAAVRDYRHSAQQDDPEILKLGLIPLSGDVSAYLSTEIRHRLSNFLLLAGGKYYIKPEILADVKALAETASPPVESKTVKGFISAISIAGNDRRTYRRLMHAAQTGKINSVREKRESDAMQNTPTLFVDPAEATAYLESHPGERKIVLGSNYVQNRANS